MQGAGLVEVFWYAMLFLALALAFTSRKMTKAFFGPIVSLLKAIPLIGGALASPFEATERAIVNACESIEQGCDHLIGASWHATARMLDWTWREIRGHAAAIAAIATPIGALIAAYHAIRALVHGAARAAHTGTAGIRRLTREYHGIEHRVKALEHELAHGIGADVLPRIRSLDRELHRVEHRVIPGLEADVATAEGDVTALGRWVKDHALLAGTTALTGAVAWALSALGLGWLRCNSNPFRNNPNACGLWGDLSALLALAVIAGEIASLDELIATAQEVTVGITEGVEALLKV